LDDLLAKHLNSTKRFSLSNNLSESLKEANVVFITVGTPTKRLENEADLNDVYEVAKEISENIVNYCCNISLFDKKYNVSRHNFYHKITWI